MSDTDRELYGEMWKLWPANKRKKAVKRAGLNPMLASIEWENIDITECGKLADAMYEMF